MSLVQTTTPITRQSIDFVKASAMDEMCLKVVDEDRKLNYTHKPFALIHKNYWLIFYLNYSKNEKQKDFMNYGNV